MTTDAKSIAASLTPAQRRAVMESSAAACWIHSTLLKEQLALKELASMGLLKEQRPTVDGKASAILYHVTPLGLAVRKELERDAK